MSRREFLASTGGLAASFLAMNQVYGKNFFDVNASRDVRAGCVPAEGGPPRDLFVFDDQTHIVRTSMNNPQGLRALAQGPGPASTAAGLSCESIQRRAAIPLASTSSAVPGRRGIRRELLPRRSRRTPVRRPPCTASFTSVSTSIGCTLQSQTSVAIISNANIALFTAARRRDATAAEEHPGEPGEARSSRVADWRSAATTSIGSRVRRARSRTHSSTRVPATTPIRCSATTRSGRSRTCSRTRGRVTTSRSRRAPRRTSRTCAGASTTSGSPIRPTRSSRAIDANCKTAPGFLQHLHPQGSVGERTQPGGANNIPEFGNPDDS